MATQICNGTGNLTGASTFAGAEVGALALVLNRFSTTAIAAATTVTSTTFTITTGKTVDAILLWLKVTAAGPTGTFKVDLQKSGVSQGSVTVNKADLPDSTNSIPIPVLFKLSAGGAGTSTSVWTIVITTTGSGTVTAAIASATTTNFTRACRTTTAATAAAADDLYIIGELTGAGTHNALTVTMDSTAATAYGNGALNSTTVAGGGIHVAYFGTLSYGTTASTNYILRVNGDLIVYQQGPFNIGSSGSEIPRNSTAVLEFQPVSADGDFGLRCMDNSVVNIAGLSRTSGKNVVKCKLTSDVASSSLITGSAVLNGAAPTSTGVNAGSTSLLAGAFSDTVTSAPHTVSFTGAGSISNTTQVFTFWLARGSGTNNRFVRAEVGNNAALASITNGFFADIDLQAGTIGTCTAVGTGTGTSATIAAVGGGFVCRVTGKVASGAATPTAFLAACSAAGTTSFAGAGNQCFIFDSIAFVTAASISDTTYNIDTDTGWLSGDVVCIPSTSRTVPDSGNLVLNANAGASSFVSTAYPSGFWSASSSFAATYSGSSPTQAEIGLLTRNVKIRSTSTTLMAYVYCTALATITFSWAEFYYLGTLGTGNKRGIEIDAAATTNAKSITFCSIHDLDANGLFLNAGASTGVTFSNNVMWNSVSGNMITVNGAISSADWTMDSNLLIRASTGAAIADVTGTFTNNSIACASSGALAITGSGTSGVFAAFNGNTLHSSLVGCNITGASNLSGIFDTLKSYHNTTYGLALSCGNTSELYFTNLTLLGNASFNLLFQTGTHLNVSGASTFAGTTISAAPFGISIPGSQLVVLSLDNVDMSGVGTGLAAHATADFNFTAVFLTVDGLARNCKFGAPTLINGKSFLTAHSSLGFEKYGQVAGDHRMEMTYGQIKTDTAIFNLASPSARLTPNTASNKLESAPKGRGIQVAVANGQSINIAAYLYKSKIADGAAYNGNQPRLIQRANPALGQNSDVVLATYGSSTGSWNQLSGNSSTATDDGVWEFVVDCDGTAGWINVDDLQAA